MRDSCSTVQLFAGVQISEDVGHIAQLLTHMVIRKSAIYYKCMYEGWNFNFGKAAVTFDTAHLQSSYFHRPSMYSPKLCRTRSQR